MLGCMPDNLPDATPAGSDAATAQPVAPPAVPPAATEVYAVVGDPVAQSMSPALHNAAFRAAGLNKVMVPIRVPAGTRITVPASMLTGSSPSAWYQPLPAVHMRIWSPPPAVPWWMCQLLRQPGSKELLFTATLPAARGAL